MKKKLLMFSAYITLLMLGVYISLYQYTIYRFSRLFVLTGAMMGLTIGVQSFGMALSPLLLGVLSVRVGKKRVTLIAYGFMITGTALAGFALNLPQFLLASFLIGAGFAVLEATLSAVLADEFSDASVRHLNFSQVAFSIGALIGPMLAATLIRVGVYFQHLYLYSSIAFLLFGVLFILIKQQNGTEMRNGERITDHLTGFFNNRILVLLAAAIFFYVGIENTVANFTDAYFLIKVRRPDLSAVALSMFWGAMIPSRFLAGLVKSCTRVMFAGCCTVAFLSILSAMYMPNPTVKVEMFALCGFGCGPIWPLLMNRAAELNRGSSGAVMNIMFSFCAMGGALMPILAGAIGSTGDIVRIYHLCGGAVFITLVLWRKAVSPVKS